MIAIIDYQGGNTRSVSNALTRMNSKHIITKRPSALQKADKVIFPGVGEAYTAMTSLRNGGLDEFIMDCKVPFLGICLGMQVLCKSTEERNTECLGIFPERVVKFQDSIKVPHMGWNTITHDGSQLFRNIQQDSHMYFVHSYYAQLSEFNIATVKYNTIVSAAINRDNFFGVQFHPEKSGPDGEQLLQNFIDL